MLTRINNARVLRAAVAAICGYEAVAIMAGNDRRLPTITYLQSRRPVLGAALVLTLAAHFAVSDRD